MKHAHDMHGLIKVNLPWPSLHSKFAASEQGSDAFLQGDCAVQQHYFLAIRACKLHFHADALACSGMEMNAYCSWIQSQSLDW